MSIVAICACAFVAACTLAVIKNFKSEFLPIAVAACGAVLTLGVLRLAEPLFDFLAELENDGVGSEFIPLLLKALGCAVICQFTAEICRDCGEASVASKVEFAGKTVIIVLSIPLIRELINGAKEMIG